MRGAISPDHIHMLLSAPAQLAPSKLLQFIKGFIIEKTDGEFSELRKKYWGQQLWAVDERSKPISKTKSGMNMVRDSRSQSPPSLEPSPSRERL